MTIQFNADFDSYAAKSKYTEDKRIRISEVLEVETATQLAMNIHTQLPFENAYVLDGEFKTASPSSMASKTLEEQQTFIKRLYAQASNGVGFFYGRHPLGHNDQDTSIVQQAFNWLNSAQTIETIKDITGHADIVAASAQATRYYPGHFLTRHNDINDAEQRRVAYVLNLSPEWHPDWGGLLQFYQQDGTPRDAWTPNFNSLVLFDVTHVHAVTYVAPFATKPRLSITGWFRAKPL